MNYKRFASHGHDNPFSQESMKRTFRAYPAKRNTWGTKKKALENLKRKSPQKNQQKEAESLH